MVKKIALLISVLMLLGAAALAEEVSIGDVVSFGSYEQDGNEGNGAEQILWTVLDIKDGKALIIAQYGLEAISWSEPNDVQAYTSRDLCWDNCYLNKWLNGEFLNAAFSADEQAAISDDGIFCLSIDEADTYFASAEAMACEASAHALQSLSTDSGAVDDEGYCNWWLRDMTSAAKPQTAYNFMSGSYNEAGNISGTHGTDIAKSGSGMPVFNNTLITVRPALRADVAALGVTQETQTQAAEEAEVGYTDLERGSKGDDVKRLQERLNELGYSVGTADGDYGKKTENAVSSFQKMNDLPETGKADVRTQELLFSDDAAEAPIVREKGVPFTINGQELTIKSWKFTSKYDYGNGMASNASNGIYLIVYAKLTNTKSSSVKASEALCPNAIYEGSKYYGVAFPKNDRSAFPPLWASGSSSIAAGESVEMVYSIEVPKTARNSGSLSLIFKDDTELVIR